PSRSGWHATPHAPARADPERRALRPRPTPPPAGRERVRPAAGGVGPRGAPFGGAAVTAEGGGDHDVRRRESCAGTRCGVARAARSTGATEPHTRRPGAPRGGERGAPSEWGPGTRGARSIPLPAH